MLLSTLFFAGMNACVKQLPHLPALEIIFFRSLFSIAVSYVALRRRGVPPFGHNHRLLISRGSTGALVCYFVSLQHLPLVTAVTVQYLGMFYALGLGYLFFAETFGLLAYAGMALVLLGVGLNAWYITRLDGRAARLLPAAEVVA